MTSEVGRNRARLLVALAAILWSTSGLFAKAPWFDAWPAESRGLTLTFWRSVFAALVVLPFIRRPSFHPAMLPMSVCFTLMSYTFLTAMVAGSETTTIWLQYVSPAWVALAGLIGLGDRPTSRDAAMIGLSASGIAVIVVCESTFGGGSTRLRPVALALLAGLMYAGVILSLRRLRGCDAAWLGLVNFSVSAICLAPLALRNGPLPVPEQWLPLAALGALQYGVPYVIFAYAVRALTSNEAALITLLEPLFVPLWTFLAWHHLTSYRPPDWWTIYGAVLIAMGFAWRYGIAARR